MLMMSADVHKNPGPVGQSKLSILHWNLGSISANNFAKLHSLQAFISVYKYDIICLSETFLDSSYSNDDRNLIIENYNMTRADYPGDVKRGGVCIYPFLGMEVCIYPSLSERYGMYLPAL